MKIPPRCPSFTVADQALFDRYLAFISEHGQDVPTTHRTALQDEARELASDLYSEAMSQGMSKVHEFSSDIYYLQQCRAVVVLIAFGKYSSEFVLHERDVLAYKDFPSTRHRVDAFCAYVQAV